MVGKEEVGAVVGDVQVGVAVVVVVPGHTAGTPAASIGTGLFADIGEGAVAPIAEQGVARDCAVGRRLHIARQIGIARTSKAQAAVDDVQVELVVAVVVEKGGTRPGRL